MSVSTEAVIGSYLRSAGGGAQFNTPYSYWILRDCLPQDALNQVLDLPFEAPALGGLSGKRELHNATRTYFDEENQTRYPVVKAISEAFQDERLTGKIAEQFGTDVTGSYLRIEFAQDTDGFWLEPHTDLGVKMFTMLLYLSKEDGHRDLGTDIYNMDKEPVARTPFAPNAAMVFVPSDVSYHGFEARPIEGVRKSIIVNYVTDEWRAREQLAFPAQPIG